MLEGASRPTVVLPVWYLPCCFDAEVRRPQHQSSSGDPLLSSQVEPRNVTVSDWHGHAVPFLMRAADLVRHSPCPACSEAESVRWRRRGRSSAHGSARSQWQSARPTTCGRSAKPKVREPVLELAWLTGPRSCRFVRVLAAHICCESVRLVRGVGERQSETRHPSWGFSLEQNTLLLCMEGQTPYWPLRWTE